LAEAVLAIRGNVLQFAGSVSRPSPPVLRTRAAGWTEFGALVRIPARISVDSPGVGTRQPRGTRLALSRA